LLFYVYKVSAQDKEVPSIEKLRQMGASEGDIKKLLEIKKQKEKEQLGEGTKKTEVQKEEKIEEQVEEEKQLKGQATGKVQETVWGQGFFRNNTLRFYQKATDIKAPDNYVLGIGDEVSVVIWGYSDYDKVFKIDKNGAIQPKLIGRIYLKGLTFERARSLLKRKFGQVYNLKRSQIDITLTYSRIITVNIVGEVFKPGSYTIPAINTAFNALIAVGGPNQIGSLRNIYIKRGGKTIQTLDVYEFLKNPEKDQDFFLENNDFIYVPIAGRIIKIKGKVKRPHSYELIEGENLFALIEYAGGFIPAAYKINMQIKRFHQSEKVLMDVNLDSLLRNHSDLLLQDGDEVIIKSIPEEILNTIEITGAIRLPDKYELKEDTRVNELIEKADGLTYDAYLHKAYVIRLNDDLTRTNIPINLHNVLMDVNSPDNITLQEFDILKVFSNREFSDQFTVKVFGFIRNPGTFLYSDHMTLNDALHLAAGLKPQAANKRIEVSRITNLDDSAEQNIIPIPNIVLSVEIGHDLSLDKRAEDFKLQPYDQIFVRKIPEFELQRNISIQGEVLYPGGYPLLNKKERLLSLIERAGGLTQWAHPKVTSIFREKEKVGYLYLDLKKVLNNQRSKMNYVLKEGDIITIPELHDIVRVTGAIDYPEDKVNTPYHKGKRAGYYIHHYAGGFDKKANRRKTYVRHRNGVIDNTSNFLFFKIYPEVIPGSIIHTVYKPEKKKEKEKKASEPIDWNKHIRTITTSLTGIATLYIILTSIK